MSSNLTIAIPFYRGLGYLREAIESVRALNVTEWELTVRDDGEEESGARELVESYEDERLSYRRNERNLGMVANWNRCIDEAQTDLVTLLHGDDRLLPGYADLVLSLASRHPRAAALFCDARIIDSEGAGRFSFADSIKRMFVPRSDGDVVLCGEQALSTLMAGNFIMCPTLCLRKSVLGRRRFSERWKQVQDLDFTSRLLMEGETLAGCREQGYAYRRHRGNATEIQSESLLRFEEEFCLFREVADEAARIGWQNASAVSGRATIVKLHLLFRSIRDLALLRPRQSYRQLRFLARHR